MSRETHIKLGYEWSSGAEVKVPLRHMAVTGQTQESGKTTTLEAIITRSNLCAIAFITKRGEKSFREKTVIPVYFHEPEITAETPLWKWVGTMLETASGENIGKEERAAIIEASDKVLERGEKGKLRSTGRKVHTLAEVQANIALMEGSSRGGVKRACICLGAYFGMVMPQIKRLKSSPDLKLAKGVNVMDLEDQSDEMQSLIIRSVIEHVFRKMHNVVVVVPEAAKFIPNRRQSPVRLAAEMFIRQGLGIGNVLMLDSQDLANVATEVLKNIGVWILGKQTEINEVKRVIAYVPATPTKILAHEIQQLGKGTFYAVYSDQVRKVYVQPAGMEDEHAKAIALGDEDAASWGAIARRLDQQAPSEAPEESAGEGAESYGAAVGVGAAAEHGSADSPHEIAIFGAPPELLERLRTEGYSVTEIPSSVRTFPCGDECSAVPLETVREEIATERRAVSDSLSAPLTSLPTNGHMAEFLRALRAHPEVIELVRETPRLIVKQVRPRIEWDGTTLNGLVARLAAQGFFSTPKPAGSVRTELLRYGVSDKTPTSNVARPLEKLTEMGFLTKESEGYLQVPGMNVEQYMEG